MGVVLPLLILDLLGEVWPGGVVEQQSGAIHSIEKGPLSGIIEDARADPIPWRKEDDPGPTPLGRL